MNSGNFPIDILLFAMVAAFLVLRLRSILGRRTGVERPRVPETAPGAVPGLGRPLVPALAPRTDPAGPTRAVPEPATVTGQALVQMTALDRSFDPARFLSGAEAAFRMIVGAYAQGDRVALRPLLTDDTYRGFDAAITAREEAGHTQRSEIRSVETAAIDEAVLQRSHAAITVRFVSDQVAETLDRDTKPVAGTDAVTEIVDLWSFERDLAQSDPAWRLSSTRSG